MSLKKRQCVLCDDGKVVTDVAKDKAVCNACAVQLMDGECKHDRACNCPCHSPGLDIDHEIQGCCIITNCKICGNEMDSIALIHHMATCHKSLHEFQGITPPEPPFDMALLGRHAMASLDEFSEVRHVYEGGDSYKPLYRLVTILLHLTPPHFKLYGVRRHLTNDEAVEVVRHAHPHLAAMLDEDSSEFLHLYTTYLDVYDDDPEHW